MGGVDNGESGLCMCGGRGTIGNVHAILSNFVVNAQVPLKKVNLKNKIFLIGLVVERF